MIGPGLFTSPVLAQHDKKWRLLLQVWWVRELPSLILPFKVADNETTIAGMVGERADFTDLTIQEGRQ